MEDQALLEKYRETREESVFSEFVQRQQDFVYRVAFSQCGNKATAEEISQEVFVKLATGKALPDPKRNEPFRGWLYVVVVNTSRVRNRSDRRMEKRHANYKDRTPEADPPSISQEALVEIEGALAKLSLEFRELIVLHYIEGISQADLGKMLGVSQSSVSRRLEEGVKLLRNSMTGVAITLPVLMELAKQNHLLKAPQLEMKSLVQASVGGPVVKSLLVGKKFTLVLVSSVAISVAGIVPLYFYIASSNPATKAAPPAIVEKVSKPKFHKRLTFNSLEDLQNLFGNSSGLTFIPTGGEQGAGAIKIVNQESVLPFKNLPATTLPLRIKIRHKLLPSAPIPTGARIACNWSDPSYSVYAPVRNIGVWRTFPLSAVPWSTSETYLTPDLMDEWVDGQRATSTYIKLINSEELCLVSQGQYLVDFIEIDEISPEELPDARAIRDAIQQIPPEKHTGSHPLSLPSPRPGKTVFLEFLRSTVSTPK